MDLSSSVTESRNEASVNLDSMSAAQIARLMSQQDELVPIAVEKVNNEIASAIEWTADAIKKGGRLIYIGAGTSGRLGVLDASECPPTFNSRPEQVVGLIAGGTGALTTAIEGAEDDPNLGKNDLQSIRFNSKDIVIGIATSGRTPYVLGAIEYANSIAAKSVGITCNTDTPIHKIANLTIAPIVGPEILSGSTRLKAGTATKMVLNRITTGAMVLLGKTFGNFMVDLRSSNEKLKQRSVRILKELTNINESKAEQLLIDCQGQLKVAIVSEKIGICPDQARTRLANHQGHLGRALEGEVL